MWPWMTFEVILHLIKKLSFLNGIFNKNRFINERAKKAKITESRNDREFFVIYMYVEKLTFLIKIYRKINKWIINQICQKCGNIGFNVIYNSFWSIDGRVFLNTHFHYFHIFIWLRFGFANASNNYLTFKSCVVCIGNF